MSFVQGPVEVSHSRQERGAKEDKFDCSCVNCGVYIHTALSTYLAATEHSRVSDNDNVLTQPVLIIALLLC